MKTEPLVPAAVLEAIRAPLAAIGAVRADAPILQPLSLVLELAGEDVRAGLFVLQSEGGAEACLRPDFTVALASAHIARGGGNGRYLYEGPVFRAGGGEEPEEVLNLGLELFGAQDAGGDADAEVASLAWRAARAGGRQDLRLWLGDVALLAAFVQSLSLHPALAAKLVRIAGRPRLLNAELARAGATAPTRRGGQLAAMLSGLEAAEAAAMLEEVWTLAGVEPVGGRGAADIARRLVTRAASAEAPALTVGQAEALSAFMAIGDDPAAAINAIRALGGQSDALEAALQAWQGRVTALTLMTDGAPLTFAPALGHAFDYYDGPTFEIRSAALGAARPVAVGGRYDGLARRLGAEVVLPAVGCTVRPWRAFAEGEA
ncbi:ATP phosphoribosyltransferase regulatory subunit [Phenylobacterium immobile]|uniref:ATP phosphoribosyltransferase regulatory subunit n=1 Tax=Phenylobacterium immobile TaxID=21 RepID=UPI000A5BDEAE|nr:ATP phosphoribosyltransferase regulatory subunit [Phenylobacterium immobile]